MKLISFDIFDTLLIRRCGAPDNIFYLTAQRLFAEHAGLRDGFYLWRCRAEREQVGAYPTLYDIYALFESDYFGVTKERAMEVEKLIESENLVKNPQQVALVENYRKAGAMICYITDMYLDEPFLRGVLEREVGILEHEQIFVSSQYKASKADGGLYDLVHRELKPKSWCHYGDNRHSDVLIARRRGVKPHLVDSRFTQAERALVEKFGSLRDSAIYSSIVGVMRSVRLSLGGGSAAEIAAGFVAPLYVAYVNYILDSAARDGVRRLYFLNRDSYILYKIAERLNHNQSLKLSYLFISRRSLVLPAIEGMESREILKLFDGGTLMGKSVDRILDFLKMSRQEVLESGVIIPFDRVTTASQQSFVLELLTKGVVARVLQERAVEQRELLVEYLTQEGVTSLEKCAFVDVGWLGSSRLMVNRVLVRAGFKPVSFYYLGVRRDVFEYCYGEYHTFFSRAVEGLMALIENYFSLSLYGSVLAYERGESGAIVSTFVDQPTTQECIIRECNTLAAIGFVDALEQLRFDYRAPLESIALEAIRLLQTQRVEVDFSALLSVGRLDTPVGGAMRFFVKSFNWCELVRYALLGGRITDCDDISLALSIKPKSIRRWIKVIHQKSNNVRCRIHKLHNERREKR